ncbi:hypothetical protein HHK36_028889 [Tetracentron sinense]|uniref:Uncharacterized protein n=1 Tax=Tetracentron sinense TaxID=13715 RepID=A0A835D3V5_TETSI|nr:hypothetical protein HHK36_028889 [Tetracentron sinense]
MVEIKKEKSNVDTSKEVTVASNTSVSDSSCDTAVPKLRSIPGRTTGPTRRSTRGGWTKEEDDVLTKAVQRFRGKNWKKIAESFSGRTDVQCLHRWQKVLDPNLIKGPWTKEEDDRIMKLVEECGRKKWSSIAKSLPGRIGKQCRERWHNHLNPAIKKDAWTKEEEMALIHAHRIYGNKWAEIAKCLPGRADNSIKNHWNCSVKKKLKSYSACGSALDLPGPIAPDFCKYETREEGVKIEAVRQSLGTVISLDQKMDSEGSVDTCSLDLVIGNFGEERHLQPQPCRIESCRFPKEAVNDLMKPPNGTQFDDRDAIASGTQFDDRDATGNVLAIEQCRDNAKYDNSLGDSHRIIAINPVVSCETSLCDAVKSSRSNKRTHEPAGLINFSSPTSPSIHVTLQGSFSNVPLDVNPLEVVLPVTAKGFLESPKRPRCNTFAMNGLVIMDSRFNEASNTTLSSLSSCESGRDTGQVAMEKDSFPSTDNHIQLTNSSICCPTPPSHVRGISFNNYSPGSILRSAAKSFKNTPSIIRKRGHHTSTQAGNANYSSVDSTPEGRTNNSNVDRTPCEENDLNSTDLLNVKRLILSPVNSLKPETSATVKSVEKCLEYAFNMEWDSAKAKCSTSATARDSSDAHCGANIMLMPSDDSK